QWTFRGASESNFTMMHQEGTTNAAVSYVGVQYQAFAIMTVASSTTTAFNVTFRSMTNGNTTVAKTGSYIAIRKIA
ncbi:MAG: hypothetical protein ABR616_18965, partial [Dermatophilaceae bacterium]